MTFKKVALTTALLASVSAISLNANADASAEVTLQGIVTNTTCNVTVNGGKSVLNVGVFKSNAFTANTITTEKVDMPVTLTDCADTAAGQLIIQGLTSTGNNEQNIFVSTDNETVGFMIQDETPDIVVNGTGPTLSIFDDESVVNTYTFKVGMASTTADPTAGSYSAPILVAYVVN
ncbi:type 1 fimbrial protein [Providencia stuartii]|nr:type 1 fimbrial protein [Providencia stuartii]MTB79061.1 type 1 fimbrial protein [Providencia stuartii]